MGRMVGICDVVFVEELAVVVFLSVIVALLEECREEDFVIASSVVVCGGMIVERDLV